MEELAWRAKNKPLHQAIIGLSLENNQYANELSSLIQSLGGESKTEFPKAGETPNKEAMTENEVLDACEKSEMFLVRAYKEALNGSFVYESLKKLIRYQLEGIKGTFGKLELLNMLQKKRPVFFA